MAGGQVPGVHSLQDHHPGILPQLPVELTLAHVQGEHLPGAALEQAVGKAAGRSAQIQADPAPDPDLKGVQCRLQLESAPGYVTGRHIPQPDRVLGRYQRARFFQALLVPEDPAAQDQRSGRSDVAGQASGNKQLVEPDLFRHVSGDPVRNGNRIRIGVNNADWR